MKWEHRSYKIVPDICCKKISGVIVLEIWNTVWYVRQLAEDIIHYISKTERGKNDRGETDRGKTDEKRPRQKSRGKTTRG